jgi:hypothetical protein
MLLEGERIDVSAKKIDNRLISDVENGNEMDDESH